MATDDSTSNCDGEVGLSDRDMMGLGIAVTAKMTFILIGGSGKLYRRVDGRWEAYPDYPTPVVP